MKRKKLFTAICLTAGLLLAGCTKDDVTDDNTLPEGKYPLQIASVTMSVESSEQPWGAKAQTRVTESENGNSSVWEENDMFYVKFEGSDDVGTYKIIDATAGTVEAVKPVYWRSASEEQTIIAWYASQDGTIDVSNQTDRLAYVIRAEQKATYSSPVSLQFNHQLSKVRVYLRGTAYAGNATGVTFSYPTYTMTEGHVTLASGTIGTIQMHKAGNADYYEALVLPGTIATNGNPFTVTLNGTTTASINLSASLTLAASSRHDVTLWLHNKSGTKEIDLSEQSGAYEISDNGDYYFYGSGSNSIKVTSGNPNIYLGNATVNVDSGNAINITGGTPTIHVVGAENSVTTSNGAGIYVASGSGVTITGNSRKDKLTAGAGGDGAGIGYVGWIPNAPETSCGNITINNVTVYARGASNGVCPGIGAYNQCGTITIRDATVYAYGTAQADFHAPAIGSYSSLPTITISYSNIYAYRGAYNGLSSADWIGSNSNSIQGTITNTVVYKNTYNCPQYQEIMTGESQTFK